MKNVILLTIDTLRKDMLGCYGNNVNLTPFIDSLTGKSITFKKAQAIGPYTQASFPGILTSSYFLEYGLEKMLNPQKVLISEPLKSKGITTAAFHSNPYMCSYFGWNRGWDVFYDSMQEDVDDINPYIKGNAIVNKADKWLSTHITGNSDYNPFFLWLHFMDIHEPYVPEKKYTEKIDESIDLSAQEMFKLFTDSVRPRQVPDEKTLQLLRKLYMAHVIEVDEYLKTFFTVLEKYNILNDSAIIITSDHGDEFNEHNSLSHDGKMYSELINVPLIIYNPGSQEGTATDLLVSNIDIPPTILNLFNLDPEEKFKGNSVLPVEDYADDGCYGEAIGKLQHKMKDIDKPVYYFRKKDLKVIYREEDDKWEMYDLESDPLETKNVIDSSREKQEMKAKLNCFINRNKK